VYVITVGVTEWVRKNIFHYYMTLSNVVTAILCNSHALLHHPCNMFVQNKKS